MSFPRPFYSVGLLFNISGSALPSFLGTCFAYKHRNRFITAHHCVGSLGPNQLGILFPILHQEDFVPVTSVLPHAEADLAVLHTEKKGPSTLAPFMGRSALQAWGEPVQALGYPEESTDDGVLPTARLLT